MFFTSLYAPNLTCTFIYFWLKFQPAHLIGTAHLFGTLEYELLKILLKAEYNILTFVATETVFHSL